MLTEKEKLKLKAFLEARKDFNGGRGLILPKIMGDVFKANGITEHYSVDERLQMTMENEEKVIN